MPLEIDDFYKEEREAGRTAPEPKKATPAPVADPAAMAKEAEELAKGGARKLTGDAAERFKWLTAGHLIFTLRNTRTGNRFTYKVSRPKVATTNGDDILWVGVLRGPGNFTDYTGLGRIVNKSAYYRNNSSKISDSAPSALAFAWLWKMLSEGKELPPYIEIWRANFCCMCGALLTVPESIERGMGPECADKFFGG